MAYKATAKLDDDDNVVGVILDIDFASAPKRSKGGKGPNLIDFTTGGNKDIVFENEDDVGEHYYKLGVNLYHPAD